MVEASATTTIKCSPTEVFDAVTDVTRMGEWSPECTGGRWVTPASGPAVGAMFEGDNVAQLGPITLKKWTTTSEVSRYEPGEVFEFVVEGQTTWRYEFEELDGATRVTESFSHPPHVGWQKLVYDTLGRRPAAMETGMAKTLDRIKATLER